MHSIHFSQLLLINNNKYLTLNKVTVRAVCRSVTHSAHSSIDATYHMEDPLQQKHVSTLTTFTVPVLLVESKTRFTYFSARMFFI